MKLSKTNYLIYLDCAHNAWIKVHRPDVYNAEPLSVFDQTIIDAGNEVDVLARELFPGGVVIARGDAVGTAEHIRTRTPILYQPVFETDRFTTACDILVWNAAAKAYDLFEVKASTSGEDKKAKNELYTYDIAFQAEVLRQNDLPLVRLYLVRLNSEYIRGDTLQVDALFTREDFTDRVAKIHEAVALEMDTAHDVLQSEMPLRSPCACLYKGRSAQCTTFAFSNPQVPSYGVHDITRIGASKKKLAALVDGGILRIEDVPDDFPLSPSQFNQVSSFKTKRAMVDPDAIAEFLAAMRYPIAFLDYETYPAAIPRFAGYRPFDQIPFQFSLDVVTAPGADIDHHEFLHTTKDNPDVPLLEALKAALPDRGSTVVWNQSFERGVNDKLAGRNPTFADWLGDIDTRVVDLMEVFSQQAYVHPGFKGRTSIKYVLPVLVPELSYKALSIREGATATARWNEIVTGAADEQAAERIRADLLAYCGLDSLAMVEIWKRLVREVEPIMKLG